MKRYGTSGFKELQECFHTILSYLKAALEVS